MPTGKPTFPNAVWDGSTANPWRHSYSVAPQQDDWNRIVAELIETQRFIFNINLGSPLNAAEAIEPISKGRLVRLNDDGRITLASAAYPSVAGMAIEDIGAGSLGSYIRRGRISAADWSDICGSVTLTAGATYFVVDEGRMSETAPQLGYIIRSGQAQTPTTFDLDLSPSVRL
jgi:hypothetical protein